MRSIDFHIHSHFSFDSIVAPQQILREARCKRLDGVAVTDHETIQGGVATAALNQDPNFMVVVGAEYSTEMGDIIGLFLQEEIDTRHPTELIDEIHQQKGLVLLPHPFHGHRLIGKVLDKVDIIEFFNARETRDNNQKAFEFAKGTNKPMLCGSDAHLARDIGTCRMIFPTTDIKSHLLRNEGTAMTAYTPRYRISASQIVKALKLRRYHHVPYHAARLIKRLAMH
jgi:predicted metal-dependent phosphoesterase TrpH